MRAFIAVDVPEEIKRQIKEIQKQLPGFDGKLTEPENLHLTLKFLGDINEITTEKIRERLKGIIFPSFESEINEIGFFDNTSSGYYPQKFIVWLHLTNCEKLQKEIDSRLAGLFEKEKRFMGHLTIARIKRIKDKKKFMEEIKKIKVNPIKFKITRFSLKKSMLTEKQPIYSNIDIYVLE